MIAASASEATATALDPLMIVVISATGGALVTALFALLGAWVSARHEHAKWAREQRFEAFVRAAAAADHFREIRRKGDAAMAEVEAAKRTPEGASTEALARLEKQLDDLYSLHKEVVDASAALELLGPETVIEALNAMTSSFPDGDDDVTEAASIEFVKAARRALKVRT